jgi:hypothetical protein
MFGMGRSAIRVWLLSGQRPKDIVTGLPLLSRCVDRGSQVLPPTARRIADYAGVPLARRGNASSDSRSHAGSSTSERNIFEVSVPWSGGI